MHNYDPLLVIMTQEERWMQNYNEVMTFIDSNHRNPSKTGLRSI